MEKAHTSRTQTRSHREDAIQEIVLEYVRRRQEGEDLAIEELIAEHSNLMPELRERLRYLEVINKAREGAEETVSLVHSSVAFGTAAPEDGSSETSFPGYRILNEIHRGGQGVVYRAIQESTRREVALKVMLGGQFADVRARSRFEREVNLAAGFKHPNIVVVHDSGINSGQYYYVMDYIEGSPINSAVRETKLTLRQTVAVFVEVCAAVAYAHQRGVIHRDIKPSNIMVGKDNTPYVVDFGLAKITEPDLQSLDHGPSTQSGHLLGTLYYMAPEQTTGDSDSVDVRTDVYALGVVLYELVTGNLPLDPGDDITQVIRSIRLVDPPRPSKQLSESLRKSQVSELDAIILKALEKEPARRYQSASALQEDLQAWLEGRPIQAKSASSLYLLKKIATRHYFHTSVLFSLILSIGALGTIAYQGWRYGMGQKAEREATDAHLRDWTQQIPGMTSEAIRRMEFGWFLMEWHGGRLERAKEIRDRNVAGTPEYEAMTFLLDDSYTIERFMDTLYREDDQGPTPALMHYAIGERLLKVNKQSEALDSFRKSMNYAAQDSSMASAAQARIQQLESSGIAPKMPAPPEKLQP